MKPTLVVFLGLMWFSLAYAQPDASERKFIHNGMSEAEVVQKIGKPNHRGSGGKRSGGRKRGGHGKQWTYYPSDRDPQTTTVITLESGRVVNVERRVTY